MSDQIIARELKMKRAPGIGIVDLRFFASRVRGAADQCSDMDVCIEVESLTRDQKEHMYETAREVGLSHGLVVSLIVCSCIYLFAAPPSFGGTWDGIVINVTDGDSLTVRKRHREIPVALSGIDAPELGQPFGAEAKKFVQQNLLHKKVRCSTVATRKDGVLCAEVHFLSGYMRCMNEEMLRNGLAWSCAPKNAHLERIARKKRKGLWAIDSPTPPEEFRRVAAAKRKIKAQQAQQREEEAFIRNFFSNARSDAQSVSSSAGQRVSTSGNSSAPVFEKVYEITGSGHKTSPFFQLHKGLVIVASENTGRGNFIVRMRDVDGKSVGLAANEVGDCQSSCAITIKKTGEYLLAIESDGAWVVTVTAQGSGAGAITENLSDPRDDLSHVKTVTMNTKVKNNVSDVDRTVKIRFAYIDNRSGEDVCWIGKTVSCQCEIKVGRHKLAKERFLLEDYRQLAYMTIPYNKIRRYDGSSAVAECRLDTGVRNIRCSDAFTIE